MNQDKAREFFSAYHEGSLDSGLRQTLEQRLKTDAQLQAEYRAFQATMDDLSILWSEEIAPPSYLNDRIHSRLATVRDARPKPSFLTLWSPRIAYAAVAAAAVIGLTLSLGKTDSRAMVGSWLPFGSHSPTAADKFDLSVDQGPHVSLVSGTGTVLTIDSNGKTERFDLKAGQAFKAGLSNPNAEPASFHILTADSRYDMTVYVPGSKIDDRTEGTGNLREFARELAGHYHTVVQANGVDLNQTVKWSFDEADATSAANAALAGSKEEAVLVKDGLLQIKSR